MRIGIDVDDTLGEFLKYFIEFHNTLYGTSLKKEDFKSYNFGKTLGANDKEVAERVTRFYDEGYAMNIAPLEGSIKELERIKPGNELYVVTARPFSVEDQTREWLKNHFGDVFSGVFFTRNHFYEGSVISKDAHCKRLGLHAILEDNLDNAVSCSAVGSRAILINANWNQCPEEFEWKNKIRRVRSWQEIPQVIGNISSLVNS